MKVDLKLDIAKRSHLASIFCSMFRSEKIYQAMGPELKGFYEQTIKWYFTPFRAVYTKLPPITADQKDIKNDDDIVVDTIYTFELELVFNAVKGMNRSLKFEKEIRKGALDNVV